MNHHSFLFLLVSLFSAGFAFAQEPGYFNHARTRCFGGGMSFSKDGKTLFHVEFFKTDSMQAARLQVATSTWQNGAWTTPVNLNLTTIGQEVSPVLSPDGNRLYFASTAPAPDRQEAGDLNIWYSDRSANGWSSPVFIDALNSNMADRMTGVDKSGRFYINSNKNGNQDIFVTSLTAGQWSTPTPVATWNSDMDEEYVSVNDELGIAFIQRSRPREGTELLYSVSKNGQWQIPVPLQYDGKYTTAPYVQRAPILSPDGSTFYLHAQGLIWQQSASALFEVNRISIKAPKHKPLSVPALTAGEPQVFGGLKLKTNNGIAFSPDMKTIYVSRYTPERDSTGNQFIKIFESLRVKESWTDFKPLPFCKAGVPFEYHPVLSKDGKRLFFNSRAPAPGTDQKYLRKNNPWYVDRINNSWSTPVMISTLSTEHYDDYASVAANGNLYFRSDRPGKGGGDIYFSELVDGAYQTPKMIDILSSADNENDVCIDPAERFIIFNRYYDTTKEITLFVSFRKDGEWTTPRKLRIDSNADWELTPSLSPDGKWFFYEVYSNIWRVETESLFTDEERAGLKL